MSAKKTPTKKAEPVDKSYQAWVKEVYAWIVRFASGTIQKLLRAFRTSVRFIAAIPFWIKSRPAAFMAWRREDRKKKKYRSFRLQKHLRPEPRFIPSSFSLVQESLSFLYKNKRVFLTILTIHAVAYVLLIRGITPLNIGTIQDSVKSVLGEGGAQSIQGNIATLSAVVSASTSSQTNAALATISTITMSLVYIWAIRQLHSKKTVYARDAYYQGLTPLVSALLILLVASIQLIPFAVAAFVYSLARGSGLFANGFEDLITFLIALFVALLSFYWLTSTIIALYIVTIPGMWPARALKAAKQMVKFQRLVVFRRILALPIIIGFSYLLLLLVVIRVVPSRVFLIVEILQLLLLPLVHTYMFKLYRSLV